MFLRTQLESKEISSICIQLIQNQKGQVAIFVALMFQVLFAFFAMIVNVGLLVHHKINLQNSVDLAAYYGAMKQAESMNALSHINYQIRQSFKLLTFRYQQLGSAGTVAGGRHPYSNSPNQIVRENDVALPFDTAFCMPYTPWDIVTGPETYCKDDQTLTIPLPGVPNFGPGNVFVNFQGSIIALANQLKQKAGEYCRYSMSMNWLQLAKYIAAYKFDIRNRKQLFLALANELSKEDPKDIQGDSIKEGVYRTLFKNLSYPNQESIRSRFGENGTGNSSNDVDFKFISSYSLDSCRGNPTDNNPPGWLKEMFVFPVYAIFDGICGTGGANIQFKASFFNTSQTATVTPNMFPEMMQQAQELANIAAEFSSNDPNQLLTRTSLGFEKNPWCVGYVGVSAKTTPKIPFSPLGNVTMKATAFAKPFGGRMGPWYGTIWPSGADQSDANIPTDALVPTRVNPTIAITNFDPNQLRLQRRIFPNHSRYLGDSIGVLSELTMAHFAKAIHEKMITIKSAWWDQLQQQDFDNKTTQGDTLAWDLDTNTAPPMRNLEISAIAPDQFDTTFYSIDPDFYNNYLKKIQQGYGSRLPFLLRGDHGSRMQGEEKDKMFSIRNQLDVLKDPTKPMVDWNTKLTYYLSEFGQLLTSWQMKTPDEYVIDPERFGKCLDSGEGIKQTEPNTHTPGSCKAGGRTGYSVKLVDGKFLRNTVNGAAKEYELGGKNQTGRIKNPPPDNF